MQHSETSAILTPGAHDPAEVTLEQLLDSFRPYQEFVEKMAVGLTRLHEVHEERIRDEEKRNQEKRNLEKSPGDKRSSQGGQPQTDAQKTRFEIPSGEVPPRKVLLLDDTELSRVLVSHYFKGLPVSIDYARTEEEAAGRIETNRYDLLLIDLGFKIEPEWISWIKGQHGHIRLAALSPNPNSIEEESRAIGMGFDLYVSRGESKSTLRKRLSVELWPELTRLVEWA